MKAVVSNDAQLNLPSLQRNSTGVDNAQLKGRKKFQMFTRMSTTCSCNQLDFNTLRSCLVPFTQKIVKSVESFCGRWGLFVAQNTLLTVVGSLVIVAFFGCGLARINLVFRPYDLWVPEGSEFYKVTQWMFENFPRKYRSEIGIWEDDNVLTSTSIQKMWHFHRDVRNISVVVNGKSFTFDDVCAPIPSQYTDEIFELSKAMGDKEHVCYESSLLEMFDYDVEIINNLTNDQVIRAVNSVNVSKHFGIPINVSQLLGGITRDKDGTILKATSTLHTWLTRIDETAVERGDYKSDVATGEKIDLAGFEWENALLALVNKWNKYGYKINLNAGTTIGNVLYESITRDAVWIGVGWAVLLLYVVLTLGKLMTADQRMMPAIVGLIAIAMSVLASYGACSMFGVPYGTLTNVLPLLLVALGVDDMYVIVTAWDGIDLAEVGGIANKAQETMKLAGAAITVTSLTDILAFVVGTTTSLPGLRYFCIYSATGVTMVYFLQGTLFVAALVVNQRWILDKKIALAEMKPAQKQTKFKSFFRLNNFMKLWGTFLMRRFVKITVILLTLTMFLFSIFSIPRISREFDTFWLVPETSSLHKWQTTILKSFPHANEKGMVFFKGVKLPDEIPQLKNFTQSLRNLPEVVSVDAWFDFLDIDDLYEKHSWVKNWPTNEQCELLIQNIGIIYLSHFQLKFKENSTDISEAIDDVHPCSTFKVEFQYVLPENFTTKQNTMSSIRRVVDEADVSGYKGAWADKFSQWETDRIILGELCQNLSIVLSVVGLITLILLTSLRASLLVLLCVVCTLVDVATIVHLWGLSLNTITIIAYILAIGICVDYAAHIAHAFLLTRGTKDERALASLSHMGSAVLHGGTSTFITFVLLSPSDSFIFVTYFKILSSVSVFGLYHALVFLPVLLSILGPDPYLDDESSEPATDTQASSNLEHLPYIKYVSPPTGLMNKSSHPPVLSPIQSELPPSTLPQTSCFNQCVNSGSFSGAEIPLSGNVRKEEIDVRLTTPSETPDNSPSSTKTDDSIWCTKL